MEATFAWCRLPTSPAAATIDGYIGVEDAHARITPARAVRGGPNEQRVVSRELDKQLKPTLNGLILDLRNNSGG